MGLAGTLSGRSTDAKIGGGNVIKGFVRSPVKIIALLVIGAFAGALLSNANGGANAAVTQAAAAGQTAAFATVLDVNCTYLASFSSDYAKILDVGTFTTQSADSIVDVTFNGRISVESFQPSVFGARFELRVDNLPTTNGRARAGFRSTETGSSYDGIPVSAKGIFTGLGAGTHTVSIWVAGTQFGGGTNAAVNPNCWDGDSVIVMEFRPFWAAFLPATLRN